MAGYTVTHPIKHKRLRDTISCSSFRGVHATIESNEGRMKSIWMPERRSLRTQPREAPGLYALQCICDQLS